MGGAFCSRTVLFGVKSGPLLWGRVAAIIMRITTAVNDTHVPRIQCFVDDPTMTVGGDKPRRRFLMCRSIVLWLMLGTRLSWKKGQVGQHIELIGAVFKPWQASTTVNGVVVGVSKQRMAKLFKTCQRLQSMGDQVSRVEVKQLAGLATWMSGVMPQMSAFTRMLWAAAAAGQGHTISQNRWRYLYIGFRNWHAKSSYRSSANAGADLHFAP